MPTRIDPIRFQWKGRRRLSKERRAREVAATFRKDADASHDAAGPAIVKGLIIREPWIGMILAGTKTWEMRSNPTLYRGLVALIRQGTGLVVGVAEIVESLPAIDAAKYNKSEHRHGVPPDRAHEAFGAGRVYPWVLRHVLTLKKTVPSGQKPGAVIWVKLSAATVSKIVRQS